MYLTSLVDIYACFKLPIINLSEMSVVKCMPELIRRIDSDMGLPGCIFGYSQQMIHHGMVFKIT